MHHVDRLILQCDHWATYATNAESHTASIPFTVFRTTLLSPMDQSLDSLCQTIPKSRERFLFHYFVTVTSKRLAPPMLAFNPFQTIFPAPALKRLPNCPNFEYKALYYAMLAQAAANMVQLGSGLAKSMSLMATSYHNLAIINLQQSIANEKREYGPFIAAILTLMLAEVSDFFILFSLEKRQLG